MKYEECFESVFKTVQFRVSVHHRFIAIVPICVTYVVIKHPLIKHA